MLACGCLCYMPRFSQHKFIAYFLAHNGLRTNFQSETNCVFPSSRFRVRVSFGSAERATRKEGFSIDVLKTGVSFGSAGTITAAIDALPLPALAPVNVRITGATSLAKAKSPAGQKSASGSSDESPCIWSPKVRNTTGAMNLNLPLRSSSEQCDTSSAWDWWVYPGGLGGVRVRSGT